MKNARAPLNLTLLCIAIVTGLSACSNNSNPAVDINTAPVANDQSIILAEDITTAITLSGSDADNDTLTYNVSTPANGSLSGTGANLSYTPNANYNGEDSFSFTVNDGTENSAPATISIVITPVNDLVSYQSAAVVIGQADFTGTVVNQGGAAGANSLFLPYSIAAVSNGILYQTDWNNSRVLGFNSIPDINNQNADFVIGQPDFTTTARTTTATSFDGPDAVVFDNNKMFVLDYGNDRILIWNTIPASGGIPADVVLGQTDFTSTSGTGCTATGVVGLETLSVVNGKMLVADAENNRVLIWNNIPETNNVAADIVLGQQDFTHCAINDTDNDGVPNSASASTLNYPAGVWTDGTRVVVSDYRNHRVLIWNSFPTSNFAPADVVLGQSDFIKSTANDDNQDGANDMVASARTFNNPYGVHSNGSQLYLADNSNNRVLIWNTFPGSNFTPADVVLGQANFTFKRANDDNGDGATDTASARTLNNPSAVYINGSQLFVTDNSNNRVLIYNE
ncbi:MAG: Ig-like domain-containing protein [Gammaproteobacteria bacterium]